MCTNGALVSSKNQNSTEMNAILRIKIRDDFSEFYNDLQKAYPDDIKNILKSSSLFGETEVVIEILKITLPVITAILIEVFVNKSKQKKLLKIGETSYEEINVTKKTMERSGEIEKAVCGEITITKMTVIEKQEEIIEYSKRIMNGVSKIND